MAASAVATYAARASAVKVLVVPNRWINCFHGEDFFDAIIIFGMYEHAHFLHDWPWISPWIKAVYKELDITRHASAPYLLGPAMHCAINCDANTANGIRGRWMKIVLISSFRGLFCGRTISFVLLRRTVHALPRVSLWCLVLYLISISGINKK